MQRLWNLKTLKVIVGIIKKNCLPDLLGDGLFHFWWTKSNAQQTFFFSLNSPIFIFFLIVKPPNKIMLFKLNWFQLQWKLLLVRKPIKIYKNCFGFYTWIWKIRTILFWIYRENWMNWNKEQTICVRQSLWVWIAFDCELFSFCCVFRSQNRFAWALRFDGKSIIIEGFFAHLLFNSKTSAL